jgi:hypothetical protein
MNSDFPKINIAPTYIPKIPQELLEDQNSAKQFHRRLIEWINDFHKSLDDEYEAGVRLVNFGQTVTFHIDDISYWNPSLISFIGHTENGEPVELIQHVSQISILLMKMKRTQPQEPKRPIGFASWEEYESQKK